jgi:hypothetical protein
MHAEQEQHKRDCSRTTGGGGVTTTTGTYSTTNPQREQPGTAPSGASEVARVGTTSSIGQKSTAWRRMRAWAGLSLLVGPSSAAYTAGITLTMSVPPLGVSDLGPGLGSTGEYGQYACVVDTSVRPTLTSPPLPAATPLPITGSVSGLPGGPSLYKVMILFYGNCGKWWNKGHNAYAHIGAAAAEAQTAGVVLAGDGTFTLAGTPGWGYATSPFDVLSPVLAVLIVPSTMDLAWHADGTLLRYVESNPIHDDIWTTAVSWLFVDRSRCTAQGVPCDAANGALTYVA